MHRDKIDTLNTRRGLVSVVETLINSSRGENGTRNETRTRKPCLNYQIVTRAANKTNSMAPTWLNGLESRVRQNESEWNVTRRNALEWEWNAVELGEIRRVESSKTNRTVQQPKTKVQETDRTQYEPFGEPHAEERQENRGRR